MTVLSGIRNVKAAPFNAAGDGSTDDTAAIQAAIDAAYADGGGVVMFPEGEFIAAGLVLYRKVRLQGAGNRATVLKLKSGANTDLIVTEDFASYTGGSTRPDIRWFGLRDLMLDGNKANNSSGWPLRIYGAAYDIENVVVKDGKSGGVWAEWSSSGGGIEMESRWSNFVIGNCEGNSLDYQGPNDSMFVNGIVFKDSTTSYGGVGINSDSNGFSGIFTNVHVWGRFNYCWYMDTLFHAVNCQGEGADTTNVVMLTSGSSWIGGMIFGTDGSASATEAGLQLGSTSLSKFVGQFNVNTYFHNFGASGKPIVWENAGYGNLDAVMHVNASTVAITGSSDAYSNIRVLSDGNSGSVNRESLTSDKLFAYKGVYLNERTDPSAPSANDAHLYVRDNGSGKTQLCVRFPTGAVQTIATEP